MPDTFADASRPPEAAIEIRLSRPQQLFNSLDPSPFHERDLDEDAEAYIVDSADEFAMKEPLKLVIHSTTIAWKRPGAACDSSSATGRLDRLSPGCIVLRQLILAMGQGLAAEIADEGLYILGWVAMWRPLEIFLYDWRPIWHRSRLFAKLSKIPVIVRAT